MQKNNSKKRKMAKGIVLLIPAKIKIIFCVVVLSGIVLFMICLGAYSAYKVRYTSVLTSLFEDPETDMPIEAELPVSSEVESYRNMVLQEAQKYGSEAYINLLLAVMMQESGGRGDDVFQASESLGMAPGTLSVSESIAQGVKVLSERLTAANVSSPQDILGIRLALQGYNFGSGYIDWAKARDGFWTQANTDSYAEKYSGGKKRNGMKAKRMGIWAYGDQYYTDHVLRYYGCNDGSNDLSGESGDIVAAARKQLGKPYKYGATGPDEFDCSGLVYYVFKETGKYTGQRLSAAGYRSVSTPVSQQEAQSGDLVFFIKSGNTHHVGIHIGNGQMIHAPRTGDVVKISDVWRNGEIVTYGRLAH